MTRIKNSTESSRHESFIKQSRFPVSAEELYAWHASPGALQRLTPPWEDVEVIDEGGVIDGSHTTFRMNIGPVRVRWTARHCDIIENRQFSDVQVRGPFSSWRHRHLFTPGPNGSCTLEDRIQYSFKLHPLSKIAMAGYIRRKLENMFEYRHRITRDDVALRRTRRPQRIVLTGAGGFIGSHLVPFLETQGHHVTKMVRYRDPASDEAFWDPTRSIVDYDFSSTNAVIHLAGEPIGEGAWTKNKMKSIMDSRVAGTRCISEKLAAMDKPPAALICASAIGYYGNRGDALMTEDDAPGSDFISEVCRAWEEAARPAVERGIRVVFLRIGVVLHPGGGALGRYLPPARLGLGGVMGAGSQYMSWISMEDLIGAVEHVLFTTDIRGPVNIAAPGPARNADFVKTLARVVRRPALFSVPKSLIRLFFGQMGREVLLSGTCASSRKLMESGYRFRHEKLGEALHFLLGK